jgi:hypothetical protein
LATLGLPGHGNAFTLTLLCFARVSFVTVVVLCKTVDRPAMLTGTGDINGRRGELEQGIPANPIELNLCFSATVLVHCPRIDHVLPEINLIRHPKLSDEMLYE